MPSVKLKNRTGEYVTYDGIETVTLPSTTDGESVTFSFTRVPPEDYEQMAALLGNLSSLGYTSYIKTTTIGSYRLVYTSGFYNFGLWVLDDVNFTATQVFETGYWYNSVVCSETAGKVLVGASDSTGTYLLELATATATLLLSSKANSALKSIVTNNGMLINISGYGIYYYSNDAEEIEQVSSTSVSGIYSDYAIVISQGCIFAYNSGYYCSAYFNETTKTVTFAATARSSCYKYLQASTDMWYVYGTALYSLNVSTGTYTEIYNSGSGRYSGVDIGDYLVIIMYSQVYTINKSTYAYSYVALSSAANVIQQFDDYMFLQTSLTGSPLGIIMYDYATQTMTTVYASGATWGVLYYDDNYIYFYGKYSTSIGIISFDRLTKTCAQLYSTGYNWMYACVLSEGMTISSSSTSYGTGLLYLKFSTQTCTRVYSTGYGWMYSVGKCIGSSNSSSVGILYINETASTATRAYSLYYTWQYGVEISGGALLYAGNTSYGFVYVDYATATGTKILSGGSRDATLTQVDTGYLISSETSSAVDGIYFWDTSSPSTVLSSYLYSGYYWKVLKVLPGVGAVFAEKTSTNYGVYLFSTSTNTASRIYTAGYYWDTIHEVVNGFLIGSSETLYATGVLFYDYSSNLISLKYSYGTHWNVFEDVEGGCNIFVSGLSYFIGLVWSDTTQTITEI